jgi:hypothetical protein
VCLADQRGAVTVLVKVAGDARRVLRQRHAVSVDAVGADVLAGDHRRTRRHADDVLVVGAAVVYPFRGQLVGDRRPRHLTAVALQRVVAHLVGGDQEDVAAALAVVSVF